MKPGHWIAIVGISLVVVLTFVILHSINESHFNDCVAAHGGNNDYYGLTGGPIQHYCHKSWP